MIELEPILLQIPLPRPRRVFPHSEPVETLPVWLVRVDDGQNISHGEAIVLETANLPAAVDFFADALANSDPRDFGLIWQRMVGLLKEYEPAPPGDYSAVMGAIDMALWDLAGRALNVPCYALAGGARAQQVDCYAGGLYVDDPEMAAKAKQLRQKFGAIQLTLTGDRAADIAAVKSVRRVIGDEAPLLVDADGCYENPEVALAVGQALEQAEVYWYQEPLPTGRWDEYAKLRPAIGPALAADKRVFGLKSFERALQAQALDAVVADLRLCGGMSGGQRLAELSWLHEARLSFHNALSPLAQMAAVHLAVAHWHAGPLQIEPDSPVTGLTDPAPTLNNGFLRLPEGNGLGVTVSDKFVERHRVELPGYE